MTKYNILQLTVAFGGARCDILIDASLVKGTCDEINPQFSEGGCNNPHTFFSLVLKNTQQRGKIAQGIFMFILSFYFSEKILNLPPTLEVGQAFKLGMSGGHGCSKRLFIDFLTKMSHFTSQSVGNPVQIIKYVDLSRFQPILKLKGTFVEKNIYFKAI